MKNLTILLFVFVGLFGGFYLVNKDVDDQTLDTKINDPKTESKQVEDLTYIHTDNTFKFNFPADLKFANLAEDMVGGSSETIIFSGTNTKRGFQVFISPYFSDTPLGADVITKGNPDLRVSNFMAVDLAGGKAITFYAKPIDSDLQTKEVWFVYSGKIYQVSTFPEFEKELMKILSTWEWSAG